MNKTKNPKDNKPKVVVLLGCTSSGKTGVGVKLADIFSGEIISADSRQVYKGMDIGSGKDLGEYVIKKGKTRKKIKYHLIDVVKPQTEFNLGKYQRLALKAIDNILAKKKLPLLVGGTGLYLQAIVDNYHLSSVRPDKKLRQELEALSLEQLYKRLLVKNKVFAEKLNESDRKNPRRLVRYLEVLTGELSFEAKTKESPYQFLLLGLDCSNDVLQERILCRLKQRLEKQGLVAEVKRLHQEGVSWKRLESFGLEYKYISLYLQDRLDYDDMVEKLFTAIFQFAKRQKTWWKRWEKQGAHIVWVKDLKTAEREVDKFLSL